MRRCLSMLGIGVVLILLLGYSADLTYAQGDLAELHPTKIVLDPAVPVEQGRSISIRVDIVNTGDGDAGAFSIDYAWRPVGASTWNTFETEELPGLRIVDQTITRTVALDTGLLKGTQGLLDKQTTFELRVLMDPDNKVGELDENNNQLKTSFSVFPNATIGKPDLRPLELNFDPVSPVSVNSLRLDGSESDTLSIGTVVRNIGEGDAPPFDVQVSFCATPISFGASSCEQELTPLATEVENQGERALGGLAEGGMLSVKADLPFRNGNQLLLAAGTYLFQIQVDSSMEISEQDEANNVLIGFLTIRGPELRPTRIDLGASPVRENDVVKVIGTVVNNGSSVAENYRVQFLINGIPFATIDGPTIDPGNTGQVEAQLDTGDFNLSAGRAHSLAIVVDPGNRIFEPDETNNRLETALSILEGAPSLPEVHPKDIVLTPPSPLELVPGVRLIITSAIINTGNAAALGFDVEFSFRPQGAQRWQPANCFTPTVGCRNQSLGRDQEFFAQAEIPIDQLQAGVTYEVRVEVDPAHGDNPGTVQELDESNNILATSFTVRVQQLPDLIVSGFSFIPNDLSQVRPGQTIQAMVTVSNLGEQGVNESFDVNCRLVDLFTGAEIDCPGQSRVSINSLALGKDRTVTFLLDTSTLDPGFFQMSFTVDPDNVIPEQNEDNNTVFSSADVDGNVFVLQGPDLSIFPSFGDIPSNTIQGQPVSISAQVFNEGQENAGRFTVRLQVNCASGATTVQQQEFLGLGSGDSTEVSFTFGDENDPNDPSPLPVGNCDLNIVVDPENRVKELNELNNSLFPEGFGVQLDVEPRLADLKPEALLFSSPVRSGDIFTVAARISNQGGRPSGPFLVQMSLCLHRIGTVFVSRCEEDTDFNNSSLVQTRLVDSLEPNSELAVSFDFLGLAPGSYVIRVAADASSRIGGEVPESNEDNNILMITPPLEVLAPPPNLRVGGVDYPVTPIAPGTAVPILATVVNAGGGVNNQFNVNFSYCRFDAQTGAFCNVPEVFTPFPSALGTQGRDIDFANVTVEGILANTEVTVPTTLLTDNLLPGNYIIRIEIDTNGAVLETDEGDNVFVTQPPLILGGTADGNGNGGVNDPDSDPTTPNSGQTEADLIVGQFELDKGLIPTGSDLDFDFQIVNQGVQDAGQFTVSVFYQRVGSSAVEFERFRVDGLGAQQSLTLSAEFDSDDLEPGRYVIIVVVDLFNEVQESFEANNRQERWLRLV